MGLTFQKNIEHFVCEHCGREVKGNGYTNHCPACLWSKHVDVHPGDRAAQCGGMMKPVSIETKAGEHVIVHRCIVCGYEKRNKVQKEDDFQKVLAISANRAEHF
jgi:rubrerythrin